VLGQTMERFCIPRDIIVICIGKSTYTRCGVFVNVATLEPEWEGIVTMEITNTGPLPAKVYAHEGICQFLFLQASMKCTLSYKDKKGVYQNAEGINYPKV
jgi:dCTP deaminase